MNYIVTDNELLFTYQSEFEAYLNYIDLIIYKCNFLTELIKENNQLNIPKFLTLKLFTTYKSTTIDIIYMVHCYFWLQMFSTFFMMYKC